MRILVNCRVATELRLLDTARDAFERQVNVLTCPCVRLFYDVPVGCSQLVVSNKRIRFCVVTWRRSTFRKLHAWIYKIEYVIVYCTMLSASC